MKQDINAIAASLFAVLLFLFTALFLLARTSYAYPDAGEFINPNSTINYKSELHFQSEN